MATSDFPFSLNDPFTLSCIDRLKRHPKRIVFTEGEDIRILQVAEKLVELEIISPILLGDKEKITALANENNISLEFINITDPAKSSDFNLFVKRLEKIERYKGLTIANAEEIMTSPFRYASMMVQYGHADGMVGGNQSRATAILRSTQQLLKPDPTVPHVFAATLLLGKNLENFGRDGYLILADTAINPEPDIDELSAITLSTASLCNRLFDVRPRVALLSHSSKGSNLTPSAQRVAAAAELAHAKALKNRIEVEIDGEIQADVALDPLAAEKKVPHMDQKGPVDVLVFPNLDSAHISSKLLQHTGGAKAYGQFIMGLNRPVVQLPMTAETDIIFGTVVTLGVEAISSRERWEDRNPGYTYRGS